MRTYQAALLTLTLPVAVAACSSVGGEGNGAPLAPPEASPLPPPMSGEGNGAPPSPPEVSPVSPVGGAGTGAPPSPPEDSPVLPGAAVAVAADASALATVRSHVEAARNHDATSLAEAHRVSFSPPAAVDPEAVVGLDRIQASALSLNDAELGKLVESGFVILRSKDYPSFPYGYVEIYSDDLPVYVSADMVLEALHRSYDDILTAIERKALVPRLERLLGAMRGRLASGAVALDATTARDADFYLGVAQSLLSGEMAAPVTDLSTDEIREFVKAAVEAVGEEQRELFGTLRLVDFSQFTPRGHYEGTPVLERYFRAMMWLGRIDFRMIGTSGGSTVLHRRQVEAALALRALLDAESLADWSQVDQTVTAFVGEHDYMTLVELDALLSDLGSNLEAGIEKLSDAAVAQAIVDGRYGEQRIASHIIRKPPGPGETLPLNASFAFFGQRYTVDSHVFSNVVFDRVRKRVMPNPLDAAFAAFGNDQAVSLLADELEKHPYAGELSAMRALVDAHPADYWQGSLYTRWLGALRTLSPGGLGGGPDAEGLPPVARGEVWGRRLLNTQLASWAELRHDTILYAKQSYTVGTSCEFPDAYVEPYPEFFRAIANFAELGESTVAELGLESVQPAWLADRITQYFSRLGGVASTLAEMAELQRTGAPHSAEHVAFINQAIRIRGGGSGDPWQTGWYKDLFFEPSDGLKFDPTIADVHTDPGGPFPVSRGPSVLHVGTGLPRPMVVSVQTCEGPRAYAGVVFAYHERQEPGFTRLTDNQWQEMLTTSAQADVGWLEPALGPR